MKLPDGPLDIIGDVHGEFDVMMKLLDALGYDRNGHSATGRRLVFLGDLVDRGPDSPAVVEKLIEMTDQGRAYCILGNHEINILLNRALPGNGWFVQPNSAERAGEFQSRAVDPSRMEDYLAFFAGLPLILENDKLRLVHACWSRSAISRIDRDLHDGMHIVDLYQRYQGDVERLLNRAELAHMVAEEKMFYGVALDDPNWSAEVLPAHAEAEIIAQNGNPIRVLTTGPVQAARRPFYAMGAWRMADRRRWWDDYDDSIPVIIGHFWRRFDDAAERISGVFGRDVFEGIPSHAWMGKRKNVYCVDYSVGQRHKERQIAGEKEFKGKLAALRFPEWQVVHDDGTTIDLQ